MINVNDPCKYLLKWISCNIIYFEIWSKMVQKKYIFIAEYYSEWRKFVKIKNLIINYITIGKKNNEILLLKAYIYIYILY